MSNCLGAGILERVVFARVSLGRSIGHVFEGIILRLGLQGDANRKQPAHTPTYTPTHTHPHIHTHIGLCVRQCFAQNAEKGSPGLATHNDGHRSAIVVNGRTVPCQEFLEPEGRWQLQKNAGLVRHLGRRRLQFSSRSGTYAVSNTFGRRSRTKWWLH